MLYLADFDYLNPLDNSLVLSKGSIFNESIREYMQAVYGFDTFTLL